MHWLRIDHYYHGEPDDPASFHQPVMCQHCELAPCEVVCPVAATTHSDEGLNVMVYNRCIGTRYCSNNCPFKVRRFNWFFNHHGPAHPRSRGGKTLLDTLDIKNNPTLRPQTKLTEIQMLGNNPDVTVRSRGVMEKCTFCVQRINSARIDAEKQDRAIRDGEVVTACQAACASEAIVFGNLNDAASGVKLATESGLNYALLGELNTRPRTTYQAVVRNPHPLLADVLL